jgi:hypothetical protein
MAPFDIISELGTTGGFIVFLLIGIAFGYILELSGFGDSKKLAAQFYLTEMRVLKVMFTAIIVAMVLIFSFSAFGYLDYSKLFVSPTFLLPQVIGGLIMGVGFVIGGYCPGTSIVAASTFKVDGMFFVGGVAFGIFTFGESVSIFKEFFNSNYLGRFTLWELFDVSEGVMVLMVIILAVIMFIGAEVSERYFGKKKKMESIKLIPHNKFKIIGTGVLVFIVLLTIFKGQPTAEEKWDWIKDKEMVKITNRDIFVDPRELNDAINDPMVYTTILDVRNERDYNIFHLENSLRVEDKQIVDSKFVKSLIDVPDNTVIFLVANNEEKVVEYYKLLKGQGILNLYILDHGINNWLSIFTSSPNEVKNKLGRNYLAQKFDKSVGDSTTLSNPISSSDKKLKIKYKKKIKIKKKKILSGGCS